MDRAKSAGAAAAGVTVVLWASAFVGIRAAAEDLSAGPLTLGRLLVGAAALGTLVAVRGDAWPPRTALPRLLACGLLWFGAYNVLLNAAEQRVDAGTAAMLVNVGPVILAVLAGVLLHEGFPRSLLTGCAIAFAGAVVIGLATSERSVDAGWGAALCVAAAAAYAGGVVAQKPLLEHTSALQVTFLACVVGAVACLPFAPALVRELGDAPAGTAAWTAYLGVFPTAVGFTTWAYALKRTSAGKMGATTYLVPPIAVVLGWAILGETPPALALAGGLLCLAGVAVTRGARFPRRLLGRPGAWRPRSNARQRART
jgi:drug/metabolite transporter (DMT)-like permease